MTNETLASIEELQRVPSPCPAPQALACDGTDIWVGSAETNRLYGLRGNTGAVFEEAAAPGRPIGMVVIGDTIRVISSETDNSRFIRRYIVGHGFKSDAIPCPDDTGSHLAYDGDNLFVSQRFKKKLLQIDMSGNVVRTIDVPREITGMVIVGGRFFLMTAEDSEPEDTPEDYRLMRIDARKEQLEIVELARVPFAGRSLAWDGTKFWTNFRAENTMVAFAPIGI